eukprot:1153917-Pelagomonas_calceolata.AAC.2
MRPSAKQEVLIDCSRYQIPASAFREHQKKSGTTSMGLSVETFIAVILVARAQNFKRVHKR